MAIQEIFRIWCNGDNQHVNNRLKTNKEMGFMALIRCPDCQSDVSDAAPACPKCGRPIAAVTPQLSTNNIPPPPSPSSSGAPKLKKTPAKTNPKHVLWIVVLAIVGWGIIYATQDSPDTSTSAAVPTQAPTTPSPAPIKDYVTTAQSLSDNYDKNEVAADNAMAGKRIVVGGVVQSVDKDFSNGIILNLATSNEYMPAHMALSDDQAAGAAALNKGQIVTVACLKMERVVSSPSGSDCELIPTK